MSSIRSARDLFWIFLNGVLIVAILFGIFGIKFLRADIASRFPSRTFSATGEGKAVAIPDIARLSFSVVTEGKDPKAIQEENIRKMNAAIDFVKKQGIDDEDRKTTQYNLSPRYDYEKPTGRSYIYSYVITQTVSLKIRNFEKIGTILAELPGLGINDVGSLSFDVDEPERYLAEARAEAFQKARAKAGMMAEAAGVGLGKVVNFSEGFGGYPIPLYERFGKGGDAVAMEAPAPQIEPGSQEITVTVNVTYEIR